MPEGDTSSGQEVERRPERNLVICCDGTANVPKQGSSSNVFRLVKSMRGHPERQRIYYDPGLGTESSPSAQTFLAKTVTKVLGLALGYGLRKNIVDAYTYLMNHYQPGDRIYMFGFSRGAYTVRAIAGMLETIGLLEEGSENLLNYAIRQYDQHGGGEDKWKDVNAFKGTLCRQIQKKSPRYSVPVHFLGVWDTVRSVGILRGSPPRTDTLTNVVSGRHAVALDEKRTGYRNRMWTATGGPEGDCQTTWFQGVHSDVGGSYGPTERGLADVAMEWMMDAAEKHGLIVDRKEFRRDLESRRGDVRLEVAKELVREGRGQWKELAAKPLTKPAAGDEKKEGATIGDTLTGKKAVKSWTQKLQKRFGLPTTEKNPVPEDLKDVVADLEDEVARRFERTHNPLIPFWWIMGWWRRRLPGRAWIHHSVVEHVRRMTEGERRGIKGRLKLLLELMDGGEDVQLVGSDLVARRREGGRPGDVLLQKLNEGEAEAIRKSLPLPAEEALEILRIKDVELWQEELSRQLAGSKLSEKQKEDPVKLLTSAVEDVKANRIKGGDGAFTKIKTLLRMTRLKDYKQQIVSAAPHLEEALGECPAPDEEAGQETGD